MCLAYGVWQNTSSCRLLLLTYLCSCTTHQIIYLPSKHQIILLKPYFILFLVIPSLDNIKWMRTLNYIYACKIEILATVIGRCHSMCYLMQSASLARFSLFVLSEYYSLNAWTSFLKHVCFSKYEFLICDKLNSKR